MDDRRVQRISFVEPKPACCRTVSSKAICRYTISPLHASTILGQVWSDVNALDACEQACALHCMSWLYLLTTPLSCAQGCFLNRNKYAG